jgi:hypothetical protein
MAREQTSQDPGIDRDDDDLIDQQGGDRELDQADDVGIESDDDEEFDDTDEDDDAADEDADVDE